ncbi:MAG: alpha-galactosidase [Acidobacteriota bacterium]|nr:alpha-galactosidase [Acidobacteriota bacterium]
MMNSIHFPEDVTVQRFNPFFVFIMSFILAIAALGLPPEQPRKTSIAISNGGNEIRLVTPGLTRTIRIDGRGVATTSLKVPGGELLRQPGHEFGLQFQFASPNRKPQGLKPGEGGSINSTATFHSGGTDTLDVTGLGGPIDEGVRWVNPVTLQGDVSRENLEPFTATVTQPKDGTTRVTLRAPASAHGPLAGVSVTLVYEVYAGFPVVRKWMEIRNGSKNWMKIDHMLIDDVDIAAPFDLRSPLTPAERGAGSSLVAMANHEGTAGVIAASEVPSALRRITDSGAMGYTDELFEWVLGPNETFTSEPVFFFGFSGKTQQLQSGASIALDRAVEGPLQNFLRQQLGIASHSANLPAPTWVTWSNFVEHIDDAIVRRQADIAAQAGFRMFAFDSGWQKGELGAEIDAQKFPNFAATSEYVRSKGLRLGLWVSCFRDPDSKDLATLPDAASRPAIHRLNGLGMSFASSWREYYAHDLSAFANHYGVSYFKQDFTNIRFGDAAAEHESRTRKESLLRGLRGLLDSQDLIRRDAPSVTTEITHEIYWGTPGVPCDLAAIEHADLYHTPPNDYSGDGKSNQPWDPAKQYDTAKMQQGLIDGAYHARQRFYALRGLPLEAIEYYAAATFNGSGSLTPQIQDRQIVSWLMGAPQTFAGDLNSLTAENISHYHDRFQMLARLESTYGIYEHFQFSGVPAPTDVDWHWWGKLNDKGEGAVVVLRGSGGADSRQVVIPWVIPGQRYQLKTLFAEKALGTFAGRDLIKGKLKLELPHYGQEIIELSATR